MDTILLIMKSNDRKSSIIIFIFFKTKYIVEMYNEYKMFNVLREEKTTNILFKALNVPNVYTRSNKNDLNMNLNFSENFVTIWY